MKTPHHTTGESHDRVSKIGSSERTTLESDDEGAGCGLGDERSDPG